MDSYLQKIALDKGIKLTQMQLQQFAQYEALLLDWNSRMNLTAITQTEEVAIKHFLDSLMLCQCYPVGDGMRLLDVGTGAGFPSVPVKICEPGVQLTLLDSLQKRTVFLEALSQELGHDDSIVVHGRAEELARKPEMREQFDVVTARAVANMQVLLEYCLPFVRKGGVFAALKGYDVEEELKEAEQAIKALGGTLMKVEKYELPMNNHRSIVLIQKISQTPSKYPRSSAKIAKSPLSS